MTFLRFKGIHRIYAVRLAESGEPGNTQRLYIPWRKGEGASIAGGKNYELLYTYRKKCRYA